MNNPTTYQIRATRLAAGLSQNQAAELIKAYPRSWENWDEEEKRESPFLSEADIEDFEERLEEHDYLLGDPLTYDEIEK